MDYVVLVLEPLPVDLYGVAESVAAGLGLPPEKVVRLLSRVPGPVTRAVPERNARRIRSIMQAAGLSVEVREGSAEGPVVDWVDLPDAVEHAAVPGAHGDRSAYASTYGGTAAPAAAAAHAGAAVAEAPPADTSAGRDTPPVPVFEPPAPPEEGQARSAGPRETEGRTAGEPLVRLSSDRHAALPEAGQTTTTRPRDPLRTTLVRPAPTLERTGLRRSIVSAATLPALLTLLVTLVVVALTALPELAREEQRRLAGVADTLAASVDGLSGGLPLTAPIVRVELEAVEKASAASLPKAGVDHLLLVDADGAPLLAWYQGKVGLDAFPPAERQRALDLAAEVIGGKALPDAASSGDWLANLAASTRTLLALVGLKDAEPAAAAAALHRLGAVSGAVVVGSGAAVPTGFGSALLTALLVGLVPVLFGLLAVLSLTRGLRRSIDYLLVATDRISHGDFDEVVELRRDDELGQIADAVERMRLSLGVSMERMRQRR